MFTRRSRVLVFGTVHLDSIIARDMTVEDRLSEGSGLIYSIGGSGFNVAANLAKSPYSNFFNVHLYSLLPKGAALTGAIIQKARSARIKTKRLRQYIQYSGHTLGVGGFIALQCTSNGRIKYGATTTDLRKIDLFADRAEARIASREINQADVVIIDSNLQVPTIKRISELCKASGARLILNLVDQKDASLLGEAGVTGLSVLAGDMEAIIKYCMSRAVHGSIDQRNLKRIAQTLLTPEKQVLPETLSALCLSCGTQTIISIDTRRDYQILSIAPNKPDRIWIKPVDVVASNGSSVGERDAVLAGFLEYQLARFPKSRLINQHFERDRLKEHIDGCVRSVINTPGATPGSTISFEEISELSGFRGLWYRMLDRLSKIYTVSSAIYKIVVTVLFLIVLYAWFSGIKAPLEVKDFLNPVFPQLTD